MSSKIARIPITNAINRGDYTAQIEIGPEKNIANVILDTGSSTLAVWKSSFGTAPTTSTPYVQFVQYGTGSWAGPVLQAQVGMGSGDHYIDLPQADIAQIQSGSFNGQPQFYPANGILGLAYSMLNQAAELGANAVPSSYNTPAAWNSLPPSSMQSLTPWFKGLVDSEGVANKFAFLTKRASVDHSTPNPTTDPHNQGWFILGGGEEQTDLYTGSFQSVSVVADDWYSTQLLSVQVGDQEPYLVNWDLNNGSNSIVDSGTQEIQFSGLIYHYVLTSLGNINPDFATWAQNGGAELTADDLAGWPPISVTLQAPGGSTTTLQIMPDNYWQLNFGPGMQAAFFIGNGGENPQSILGLPLMNNYYVVFDRSAGSSGLGQIKFAAQAG